MHRGGTSTVERSSAMRIAGIEPIELALSSAGRVGGEPGADATDRRAISEDALLRHRRMGRTFGIGRDRAGRLLRRMGLQAIYPKPRLSQNTTEHRIYPYLLRNLKVVRPNQVWASDITYVPMPQGWMYLTVVMDWLSRCVLSWRLSNTLDGLFCLEALEAALCDSAGNLQHGPGRAVHRGSVYGAIGGGWRAGEHGRPWPLDGQRVRGAIVADGEI